MDKELWDKCQLFVDASLGYIVKDLYLEEFARRLTANELAKLGDLSSVLDDLMASKNNMKKLINGLIELTKKGVIIGQKKK
jgi:hypothetical protein